MFNIFKKYKELENEHEELNLFVGVLAKKIEHLENENRVILNKVSNNFDRLCEVESEFDEYKRGEFTEDDCEELLSRENFISFDDLEEKATEVMAEIVKTRLTVNFD